MTIQYEPMWKRRAYLVAHDQPPFCPHLLRPKYFPSSSHFRWEKPNLRLRAKPRSCDVSTFCAFWAACAPRQEDLLKSLIQKVKASDEDVYQWLLGVDVVLRESRLFVAVQTSVSGKTGRRPVRRLTYRFKAFIVITWGVDYEYT